jgi:hypothetical protein
MKNIYHPAFQVAYYLQCLPQELLLQIPRTTKFDWNHKDVEHLCGYDWYQNNQQLFETIKFVSNHQNLLTIIRALIRIIAIKRFIVCYTG